MISQIMKVMQKKRLVICWIINPPNGNMLKKGTYQNKLKWSDVWQGKNEDVKGKLIKETYSNLTGIYSFSHKSEKDNSQSPTARSVHIVSGLPCFSDSAILIKTDY